MLAKDIMSTPVITIRPDATVGDAADLMLDHRISCLPVLNERDQQVGILTHTDFELHHRLLGREDMYTLLGSWATPEHLEAVAERVHGTRVKEVMTDHVVAIGEDTPIAEVAELMLRRGIHHLPVSRDGKLVGIITRHDLLKLMSSDTGNPAETGTP